MTRWAMAADLRRCVGCQTCTAACKHTNATPPLVQWRRVLDIESGEYPNVSRTFVPVGCMHCADPPCMHVCPSTATRQRDDGIVTIDYDLCIGCAFCAVACPYQARYKVDKLLFAYGRTETRNEAAREDPRRLGVAQKCTFCADRVDYGLEHGLTPGIDAEATPACVNSCIADALHFGDSDDPTSNISQLLRENRHFRMHEELGTDPGFHYLWDGTHEQLNEAIGAADAELVTDTEVNMPGVAPWRQTHWDWRAAANFMFGGTGSGLLALLAATAFGAPPEPILILLALGLVALGLNLVWLEIGRPWRFLHVIFNPQTSWMTRESIAALLVFAAGLPALLLASPELAVPTGLFALVFLYCQARILLQSKGVPLWREPRIVPVILATGLTEGCGLPACRIGDIVRAVDGAGGGPAGAGGGARLCLAALSGRVDRERRAGPGAGCTEPDPALDDRAWRPRAGAVGGRRRAQAGMGGGALRAGRAQRVGGGLVVQIHPGDDRRL